MRRIAYISTYIPQRCGLATYTHHVRQNVRAARGWTGADPVYAVSDAEDQVPFSDPVLRLLPKRDRSAYRVAAEKLNLDAEVGVVSLQHEFGIFGGEAGSYVLELVERLEKPLVTTFHTVFERPEEPYRSVQERIARRSDRIVVMNRQAARYLCDAYRLPPERIVFVPHGAPTADPAQRPRARERFGWSDRVVLLTFGLLSRGKGLETIIRALPAVAERVPNVLYVIVGQTHPEVRKWEGEAYREELRRLVRELGLERQVEMIDRYVDEHELVSCLTASDLYVTPYPSLQQITSGTLAYAVGLGRPVLSTPYLYARDLLADAPELLVPAEDPAAWERKLIELCAAPERLAGWAERMARLGRRMQWPEVGRVHARLFEQVMEEAARATGPDQGGKLVVS